MYFKVDESLKVDIKSSRLTGDDTSAENITFTTQLQAIARHFSSISHKNIRQYAINFVKELSKYESEEKALMYTKEMLNHHNIDDK
ncbi:MAG: hypothetical protein ACI9CD_001022 [Candidatus Deianiraeaceae bacterium]|jgi:hypothetical protein